MDDEAVDDVLREMKRSLEQDTSSEPGPDCPTLDALDSLAVGELPAADADLAMAHVGGCARCARYLSLAVEAERPLPEAALEAEITRARLALDPTHSPASSIPEPGLWERVVAWVAEPWLRAAGVLALAGLLAAVVGIRWSHSSGAEVPPVAIDLTFGPGYQSLTQGDEPDWTAEPRVYSVAGTVRLSLVTQTERPELSMAVWVCDGSGRVVARCPSPSCFVTPRVDGFRLEAPAREMFLGGPGGYRLLIAVGTTAQLEDAADALSGAQTPEEREATLREQRLPWSNSQGVTYVP